MGFVLHLNTLCTSLVKFKVCIFKKMAMECHEYVPLNLKWNVNLNVRGSSYK